MQEHPEYQSELIFEGFNDTYSSNGDAPEFNPWHFQYRVFERTTDESGKLVSEEDILEPFNQKHFSNPNIRAINNCYEIINKDNRFKVASNSLSQHFVS